MKDEPADKPESHTGARAILTVEQRVTHIVGMMERLEWVRGKSGPILAAEWGVSLSVVEKASAEAHRRCVADRDDAARDISQGALKLFREAILNGDAKAAKLMGDLLADVSGARAPERRELSATVTAGATPEEASRLVRETFGGHALPKEDAEKPEDSGKLDE